jgi:dipeptidyl aminopeptidase/acylaminoacyl peptidase
MTIVRHIAFFVTALLIQTAFSQGIDRSLDALATVKEFGSLSVSADGSMAGWIETTPTKPPKSSIFVKSMRGGAPPMLVMTAEVTGPGLAWSRDGRLAFLASGDASDQLQLYIAEKPGQGKARKVTNVKGYLSDPAWAPDGRSIAMLWIEGLTRIPGPTEATMPDSGVVSSQIFEQRLAIVNPANGNVRAISPAPMYVYEFDWSPDSKSLAYLAAPGAGDDNWYVAELYAIDAASGAVKHVLKPPMQAANIRWSPDGQSIAYIGGLMSDEGVIGGDIFSVSAAGGTPRNLTPSRKSSPNWFRWTPSSKQILLTEGVSGNMAISTLDVASGSTETVWKGPETIVFSGDASSSAVIRSSWNQPAEIWSGRLGAWERVSHANDGVHAEWGDTKSIEWKSDGSPVQGWLLFPKPYDPSKKYPMIVTVHGGPASELRSSWPRPGLPLQLMSAQGYFVFFPNPRGSYGHGEEFTRGNVKDFGAGDLRDILAGVDSVVKNYPVDDKRVGVAGWSYGGYMTMWTVTQTNRFRAAFAGAGIANWQSYYGQNSIDQWMIPYFGASVYDDPAVYAKSSPINFIKNTKTPTLVAVGERDGECPPAQSYEFWHALKTLGVKTEMVIYPGEGHHFHDPEHSHDLFRRVVTWFDDNMR